MTNDTPSAVVKKTYDLTSGSVGAGFVLIVLPCVALYFFSASTR
jgi:hypothetical protein